MFVGFYAGSDERTPPTIREYTPTGNPVTDADKSGRSVASLPKFGNVAVDGSGHIYATAVSADGKDGTGAAELQTLTATTTLPVDPRADTVAVEPTTNDVYAGRGTEILQYATDGTLIDQFGEGRLLNSFGLSIDGAGGDIYAAVKANDGRVDVFGALATLPDAVVENAGAITRTTAVLHGTIAADSGLPATCKFEYTTQGAFNSEGFEAPRASLAARWTLHRRSRRSGQR